MIDYALQRLRAKLDYSNVAYSLLPAEFSLSQLQSMYEAILSRRLDKRNFRKRIVSLGYRRGDGTAGERGAAPAGAAVPVPRAEAGGILSQCQKSEVMMAHSSKCILIVTSLALLAILAIACGGGGDGGGIGNSDDIDEPGGEVELSLVEYFQQIDAIFDDRDKQLDELDTELQSTFDAATTVEGKRRRSRTTRGWRVTSSRVPWTRWRGWTRRRRWTARTIRS